MKHSRTLIARLLLVALALQGPAAVAMQCLDHGSQHSPKVMSMSAVATQSSMNAMVECDDRDMMGASVSGSLADEPTSDDTAACCDANCACLSMNVAFLERDALVQTEYFSAIMQGTMVQSNPSSTPQNLLRPPIA